MTSFFLPLSFSSEARGCLEILQSIFSLLSRSSLSVCFLLPGGLKMRKQVLLFSLFPVSQIPFITLFCFLIRCLYCLSPSFFSPGDSLPPLSFSTDTHHSGPSFLLFASMLWADETLSLSLFWTAAFTQLRTNRNITLTLLNNSVSDFSQRDSIGPEFQHLKVM